MQPQMHLKRTCLFTKQQHRFNDSKPSLLHTNTAVVYVCVFQSVCTYANISTSRPLTLLTLGICMYQCRSKHQSTYMCAEALVCALIKTDLRAEHINCLSILLFLILLLAIVCKEAQSIGPITTQSMGKLLQNAYITITSSNNSAFKWITRKRQKIRHPPGLS